MKYLCLIIIFLPASACLMAQTAIAPVAGSGTEGNPYQIASLENLYWIAASNDVVPNPNQAARWSSHYIQTADINASDTENWFNGQGWTPVGTPSIRFTGSYDGSDHTISDLFISRPATNDIGFFGDIGVVGIVSNLGLVDANVTGGNYFVGILASYNSGTVENSYATGTVSGGYRVGGLVGENNTGTVSGSHAVVYLTAVNGRIGGLVGFNVSGTVYDSHSSGTINGGWYVGGLVGRNLNGVIYKSYSTADVSGSSSVGGLVGSMEGGYINNSYATGSATGGVWTGGFVGYCWPQSSVSNSYSTGSVSGSDDVGGFIGYQSGTTISNSYWDTETSGYNTSAGGLGRTTDEMTYPYAANTYTGWDFSTIWQEDPGYHNSGYPYLIWQELAPVLPPPQNLVAEAGNEIVYLSWTEPELPSLTLLGYNVYREGVIINLQTVVETQYEDLEVLNGTTYEYYVTSLYVEGESGPSNVVEATPEASVLYPPQNLTWEVINEVNILLMWEPPEIMLRDPELLGYRVYRDYEMITETYPDIVEYLDENVAAGVYIYYLTAVYDYGESEPSNEVQVEIESSAEDVTSIPVETILHGNHPNPFNPETTISFSIAQSSHVLLEVFNLSGQRVTTLINEELEAGSHSVVWNGKTSNNVSVGSGVYFYRIRSGSYSSTKKMILLK